MSKFAIDDRYLETLERERVEREFMARRQVKLALESATYYAYGWVEPEVATVTALTRPTLTNSHSPTTPNQGNS